MFVFRARAGVPGPTSFASIPCVATGQSPAWYFWTCDKISGLVVTVKLPSRVFFHPASLRTKTQTVGAAAC